MTKMRAVLTAVLLGLWSSLVVSGQTARPADEISEVETAPVMIDDLILFPVSGIRTYPASERARQISLRIKKIAADPRVQTSSLAAVDKEGATTLLAGDTPIMRVLDTDASREAQGLS